MLLRTNLSDARTSGLEFADADLGLSQRTQKPHWWVPFLMHSRYAKGSLPAIEGNEVELVPKPSCDFLWPTLRACGHGNV